MGARAEPENVDSLAVAVLEPVEDISSKNDALKHAELVEAISVVRPEVVGFNGLVVFEPLLEATHGSAATEPVGVAEADKGVKVATVAVPIDIEAHPPTAGAIVEATPADVEMSRPTVVRSEVARVNLAAIPTDWEDIYAESLQVVSDQAIEHSSSLQVPSLPSLIASSARQEPKEVDVTDQSFAWTQPADMPIDEPSEKFLMDFLSEDPGMDRSDLWPLVKFEMTKGQDLFWGIIEHGSISRYDLDAPEPLHYQLEQWNLVDHYTQAVERIDRRIQLVAHVP